MRPLVLPPEHLLEGVGSGDFEAIGREAVDNIDRFAGLRPDERVLDVGCGLARVVQPLSEVLTDGTYDGIDTVPVYVEFCRSIGLDGHRFRFHHADLYSSFYNPTGSIRPEEFRFPWPDRSFSLVIATSLFTHLSDAAAENYLCEVYRVLEPGGRLFSSFFVLDGWSLHGIEEHNSVPPFHYEVEHGRISTLKNPEFAVAFDCQWLLQVFQSIGWEITAFERGKWRRPLRAGPSYQDLVVARRPSAG